MSERSNQALEEALPDISLAVKKILKMKQEGRKGRVEIHPNGRGLSVKKIEID